MSGFVRLARGAGEVAPKAHMSDAFGCTESALIRRCAPPSPAQREK